MNNHDFGPDYHSKFDSKRIYDSTPKKLYSRLEERYNDADGVMVEVLNENDA
jgi:hypothetical protein